MPPSATRATSRAARASGWRSASCSRDAGSEAAIRPAVVALDEPTRGMDQARKRELAERLGRLAAMGAAVLVATHDIEFAARASRRCVLLGRGRVVADGSTREVLSGGRYFTTEVARVLGPEAGVVLAEEGASMLAPGPLSTARDVVRA